MIPLLGIHDAAAGEKAAPQEGSPAAALLQQAEVDMEGQLLLGIVTQQIDDSRQFLRIRDLEDPLSPFLRQAVEPEAEGLLEEPGEAGGEVAIFRDDPDLRRIEGVAVQQDAVGFRPGAAEALDIQLA